MNDTRTFEIVEYRPEHRASYEALNLAWIRADFGDPEPMDAAMLSDPDTHVLAPGGAIFVAESMGVVIGTACLLTKPERTFELAKMTVGADWRGHGIGEALARHAIEFARETGHRRVVLESSRKLTAALALYQKLGFVPAPLGFDSPFCRCDVTLELLLE